MESSSPLDVKPSLKYDDKLSNNSSKKTDISFHSW